MKRVSLIFAAAVFFFADGLDAAERHPLFQDHSILKAVLTAPISQAYAQRDSDVRLYLPGQWTYLNGDGEPHRLEVSIRIRGNFRKKNCELPPIQLNFKKSQVKGTLFKGQNKLKLVSPCQHGIDAQQKLLLEYLAYRTYEILTDRSFGARLIRLSYVDSDEKRKSWTDLAFVIEDEKDIGDRLGFDKARVAENRFEELDQPTTALFELFQLLIANNDYSVMKGPPGEYCCHNAVMYTREEEAGKRIPIPYDFDMSGLVDANYASPPRHLPIRLVRTRYYRGLCQPTEVMEAARAHMLSKKKEIISLFLQHPELSRSARNRNVNYVRKFFAMLENETTFKHDIVGRCRGRQNLEAMQAGEEPPDP